MMINIIYGEFLDYLRNAHTRHHSLRIVNIRQVQFLWRWFPKTSSQNSHIFFRLPAKRSWKGQLFIHFMMRHPWRNERVVYFPQISLGCSYVMRSNEYIEWHIFNIMCYLLPWMSLKFKPKFEYWLSIKHDKMIFRIGSTVNTLEIRIRKCTCISPRASSEVAPPSATSSTYWSWHGEGVIFSAHACVYVCARIKVNLSLNLIK